jgi:hypothetical protein
MATTGAGRLRLGHRWRRRTMRVGATMRAGTGRGRPDTGQRQPLASAIKMS